MLTAIRRNRYSVKKDTESVDSTVLKTKDGRPFLSSKCVVCGSKKSRIIKEQTAKGLLSSLGIKIPLNKIPLLGDHFVLSIKWMK